MDTNHDCCAGGVEWPMYGVNPIFAQLVQDTRNRRANEMLDNIRLTRNPGDRYLQRITAEEPMETETKPFDWAVAQQHPAYVFTKDGEPVTHLVAVGDHHIAGYVPSQDWPRTWKRSTGAIFLGYDNRDLVLRVPKPAAPHEIFVNVHKLAREGSQLGYAYLSAETANEWGRLKTGALPIDCVALAERYVRAADCELPSHHKIGDRVIVWPSLKREWADTTGHGVVSGVTFRADKVTYDIFIDRGGEELRNVDSAFVSA